MCIYIYICIERERDRCRYANVFEGARRPPLAANANNNHTATIQVCLILNIVIIHYMLRQY